MAVDIIEVVSSGCSTIDIVSNSSPFITVSSAVASCGGSIDTSLFYLNSNPSGFITAAQAGGVLTLNSLSGFINLTGINNLIFTSGQYIFISGSSVGVAADHSDGINLSGNLTTTGQTLYTLISNYTGYNNSNPSGYLTFVTGDFYPYSNPSNFANSGDIQSTGQNILLILINATGYLISNPSGFITGFNSGQYYLFSNPNNYSTSGDLQSTGNTLYNLVTSLSGAEDLKIQSTGQNILNILSNYTGYNNTNPSGYVTTGQTGQFYPFSNPNNYATSGNLQSTGLNLQTSIGLVSGNLIATGVTLGGKIDSLSGYINARNSVTGVSVTGATGITGLLTLTGYGTVALSQSGSFVLISGNQNDAINLSGALTSSGQTLYNYITNVSGNLDTRLYQTGSNLLSLISAASAGVSSINGASGVISFTGKGNVTVISGGIGTIQISGDTGVYANFYPFNNPLNFATSGNLQSTGSTLDSKVNSLSGFVRNTSISVTGNIPFTGSINISGLGTVTILTGEGNFIYVSGGSQSVTTDHSDGINLSGNLTITGQTLYNLINNFSGIFNNSGAAYQTQINTLNTNLANTGISLKSSLDLISGNLITTGVNLGSKIDSLSGFVNNTSRVSALNVTGFGNQTGIINVSGLGTITIFTGAGNFIYVSGTTAGISADHSDGVNLSGNLTITGQTLYNYIANTSGNLTTNLYQTGSNLYNLVNNFSGVFNSSGSQYQNQINTLTSNLTTTGVALGGKIDSLSGYLNARNSVTGLSVTGATGITGLITFTGHNIISLYQSGSFIGISGDTSSLASTSNLYQTGSNLYNLINNFSGVFTGSGAQYQSQINTLNSNLTSTGQTLYNYIVGLSGVVTGDSIRLQTTGSNLYNLINNFSGVFTGSGAQYQSQLNTLTNNLTSTGQTLYNYLLGLTGVVTGNEIRFQTSGSNLYNLINNFSGVFNASGAQYQTQINTLAVNLTTTGVNLGSKIDSVSGWMNNTSRVSAINVTGFGNQTGVINLTGAGSVVVLTGINNTIIVSGSSSSAIIGNYVSGINASGAPYVTGGISFSGIGGSVIVQSGNTFFFSGTNIGGVTNNNNYYVNSGSGAYVFRQSLETGISEKYINYPVIFDNRPLVLATLNNDAYNDIIPFQISGIAGGGFWAIFGETIDRTGYFLDIYASNFTGTGLATTIVVNNIISGTVDHGDGINLSGNLTTTGQTLYTYITNTSGNLDTRIYQTGSNLYNLVNNFSGVFNNSGAAYQSQINTLTTNLASTGVSLKNSINLLSGNLIQTGVDLRNYINSLNKIQFGITIDGGGSVITTGDKGYVRIPRTMTISGWDVVADQSGSIVVDVQKTGYSNFPPSISIAGNQKPSLTGLQTNQNINLTGWYSGCNQGDYIKFYVDSVTTVTRVNVSIYGFY